MSTTISGVVISIEDYREWDFK